MLADKSIDSSRNFVSHYDQHLDLCIYSLILSLKAPVTRRCDNNLVECKVGGISPLNIEPPTCILKNVKRINDRRRI